MSTTEPGPQSGTRRLRAWIAALALISALAGGLAGILIERHRQGGVGPTGPFEAYEQRFLERFELPPERARLLSQVLRHYQLDLEAIRQGALEESMGRLEPELEHLGLRYRDLIRNHVLPEADRGEYDRLAQAEPWSASSTAQ